MKDANWMPFTQLKMHSDEVMWQCNVEYYCSKCNVQIILTVYIKYKAQYSIYYTIPSKKYTSIVCESEWNWNSTSLFSRNSKSNMLVWKI